MLYTITYIVFEIISDEIDSIPNNKYKKKKIWKLHQSKFNFKIKNNKKFGEKSLINKDLKNIWLKKNANKIGFLLIITKNVMNGTTFPQAQLNANINIR